MPDSDWRANRASGRLLSRHNKTGPNSAGLTQTVLIKVPVQRPSELTVDAETCECYVAKASIIVDGEPCRVLEGGLGCP